MMFENDLTPDPTMRSQLVAHIPVALLLFGAIAMMFALHMAVTGVVLLALAHVLVGAGLVGFRRWRANRTRGESRR